MLGRPALPTSPLLAPCGRVDGFAEPDEMAGAFQEGLAGGGGISAVTELHFFGGGEELLQLLLGGGGQAGAFAGEAGEEFFGGLVADAVAVALGAWVTAP